MVTGIFASLPFGSDVAAIQRHLYHPTSQRFGGPVQHSAGLGG